MNMKSKGTRIERVEGGNIEFSFSPLEPRFLST
jgi:hypothetical protein